jgi:hypothetical protein
LGELKKVGIIKGNIAGPSVCYCIDEKVWNQAKQSLGNLFESFENQNCC